jgi:hypothetical protein
MAALPRAWLTVLVISTLSRPTTPSRQRQIFAECATCKPPVHSWATLPVSFHSSEHVTNARGEFTEAEIATISKFPLVTIVRHLQHSPPGSVRCLLCALHAQRSLPRVLPLPRISCSATPCCSFPGVVACGLRYG